jgi:transcriptional regulator with XRE-family HTH domain
MIAQHPLYVRLRQASEEKGVSISRMAVEAGIAPATLLALRRNLCRRLDPATCLKLVRILDLDLACILELAGHQVTVPADKLAAVNPLRVDLLDSFDRLGTREQRTLIEQARSLLTQNGAGHD